MWREHNGAVLYRLTYHSGKWRHWQQKAVEGERGDECDASTEGRRIWRRQDTAELQLLLRPVQLLSAACRLLHYHRPVWMRARCTPCDV